MDCWRKLKGEVEGSALENTLLLRYSFDIIQTH